MRVVAYTRVSTESIEQKNSIENQKKHYLDLFQKNKLDVAECGLLYKKDGSKTFVKGIYADEGITGKSATKVRGAFNQMISDAKMGQFDRIYIKNVARFSRYAGMGQKTYKELKVLGVEIIFEDGNLSTMNGANEFIINVLMNHAQEESRAKSIAVQYGVHEAQKAGKYLTSRPFGYSKGKDKKGEIVINPEEAKIVRQIFDYYLNSGWGTGKIARWLNNENIPTKKGKQWSQKQICTILDNPIYNGIIIQHKKFMFDINEETEKAVPEKDWIKHDQREDIKIIDDITFKLTQEERIKRVEMLNSGHRSSSENLLSNILYCGNCGSNMKRKKRHSYVKKDGTKRDIGYEWTCQKNDMYGKSKCDTRNANTEEVIIEEIKNLITKEKSKSIDDIENILKKHIDASFKDRDISVEISELQKKIDDIQLEIKTNLRLLSKEIISDEQYQEQNDSLQKELSQLNNAIGRIQYVDKEIDELRLKYQIRQKYINEIDINNLTNANLKKIFDKLFIKKHPSGKMYFSKIEMNIPQFEQ